MGAGICDGEDVAGRGLRDVRRVAILGEPPLAAFETSRLRRGLGFSSASGDRLKDILGATGDPLAAVALDVRVLERKPAWNLLGFEAASAEVSGTTSEGLDSSAESVTLELLMLLSLLLPPPALDR